MGLKKELKVGTESMGHKMMPYTSTSMYETSKIVYKSETHLFPRLVIIMMVY